MSIDYRKARYGDRGLKPKLLSHSNAGKLVFTLDAGEAVLVLRALECLVENGLWENAIKLYKRYKKDYLNYLGYKK